MNLNLSIRSFLVLLAISFTIPAVLLFGFIEASSGVRQSRQQAQEMNRQAAMRIQQELEASVERFRILSEGLSVDIDLDTLQFAHPDRIMRIFQQHPGIDFRILDPGTSIDFSDTHYMQQAIRTGQTVVSGAIRGGTGNTAAVVFCVPLIDVKGDVKGVLAGEVPAALLNAAQLLLPDQFALVIDAAGGVVYSSDARNPAAIAASTITAPLGESRFSSDGVGHRAFVTEVRPAGWRVMVGLPEAYISARAREAIGRAIVVGLLCTLIGAALASVVAFSTVRGLDRIAQQVQQMSAANLRPIQFARAVALPREVRKVINNFNNLLDRTARAHLAEFDAISRVADTILIAHAEGPITYANQTGVNLFGDPVGRPLSDILGEEAAAAILSTVAPREWKVDLAVRTADGSMIDAFISTSRILDNDKLTSVVLIVQDITREKAARDAFAQSEKMITLGELVAGTSHELNNPLAIVAGYADLLLEEDSLKPDQRAKIESVRKNAVRAANIVHSLLAFARKRKPERVRTDLNAVVEAAVQLKDYDIRTSGIHFEKRLAQSLPSVSADPNQIQQVLLNVINNAQDAVLSNKNSPKITVRSEARNGKVWIKVEDNGAGISKRDLKKVFDPFFTTKPLGKGTGLGLSISYGIIRAHGGDIRIQSRPGQGTQVSIELAVDENLAPSLQEPSEWEAIPTVPKTFLVVDDEPEILSIVSKELARNGSVVDCASSFEDALQLAKTNEYDFVITDIKMPHGSGIDLYKQICQTKPGYRQRVVFLTGDTNNPATIEFLESEGLLYFPKPVDISVLRRCLSNSE
jgi:PAS domain S-box-containing protein